MMFPVCHQRFFLKTLFTALILIQILFMLPSFSQVLFADPSTLFVSASGSGTSCSQASPCNLETAVTQANSGDIIYIGQGTYTSDNLQVLSISKDLSLYGGWNEASSGAIECDPAVHPTILDGQNSRRVIHISGTIAVTINGITVANGMLTDADGAGLYSEGADLTLFDMIFDSNLIEGHGIIDYAYGGGACIQGGSANISGCSFLANSSWATKACDGGGVAIINTSTALVENSLFRDNDAWNSSGLYFSGEGVGRPPFTLRTSVFHQNGQRHSPGSASGGYAGAISIHDAQAHIEKNTFTENKASNDYGAVAVFYSDLLFMSNIVYGNESGRVSGLYLCGVLPYQVINNVIAGNRSLNSLVESPAVQVLSNTGQFLHNTIVQNDSHFGIKLSSNAGFEFTNNILAGHTVGITVDNGSTATMEATLWGSGTWANDTDWQGDGTIDIGTINRWGDPEFVDPENADYHIGVGSAARNAGVDAGVTTDMDGDSRPIGPGFDIGADEIDTAPIITPVLFLLM